MKKFKYFIPVNRPLLNENDVNSVSLTVKSGWVSSGSKITEFEKRFANYANKKYASCVSSGSAALEIAIKSLNISCGDEVITPAFSIISNSNAIIKNLAKPILVDTDLDTWNIDINQMEKKISSKTKAIMLPHIYGFPNDMDKIQKICRLYKLYLIEDASEMIGQKYKKKVCGSFGDVSTFSFYVNKHITTGEGGMIVTNDKKIHNKINELKNLSFGKKNRFNHDDIGWNYRFTNLQAALGLSQLNRIKQIVKKKIQIGQFYYDNLINNDKIIIQPKKLNYAENIYWVFGILLKTNTKYKLNEIREKLKNKNIETRPFFWPMNKQFIYNKMGLFRKEKYPSAEYLANNGFYIPSGLGITKREQIYIVKQINSIIK